MAYDDVLQHEATPLITLTDPVNWIEGDPDEDEVPVTPVPCALFLPLGGEDNQTPRGRRSIRRPTLLLAQEDLLGDPVELSTEDRLSILAPELTGPEPLTWQIDGHTQPFGRPGEEPIGKQVIVKRVED